MTALPFELVSAAAIAAESVVLLSSIAFTIFLAVAGVSSPSSAYAGDGAARIGMSASPAHQATLLNMSHLQFDSRGQERPAQRYSTSSSLRMVTTYGASAGVKTFVAASPAFTAFARSAAGP